MIRSNAGIYTLYNKSKEKYYIGQSSDLKRRKTEHFSALKNNRHNCIDLQNDYNNGDEIKFCILAKVPNHERLLLSEEARYIKMFKDIGNDLYNTYNTDYNFLISRDQLLEYISTLYLKEHYGKTFKEMTLGKNPARFDYVFRLLTEPSFDAEQEKVNYCDYGYYLNEVMHL